MKSITFRLEDELYDKIIETAKQEERNISNLMRLAVKEYLQKKDCEEDES